MTVEMTESTITRDHTATITIEFKNTGDDPIYVTGGKGFPFSPTESEDFGWGLLYGIDDVTRVSENCWEPEKGYDAFARAMSEHVYELAPDEHRTANRWLWSHPAAERCMPTGGARFRTDATLDSHGNVEIEWGFDLRISTD